MFDRPLYLWLMLALPMVALPAALRIRRGQVAAAGAALALRVGCFVALVFMIAGLNVTTKTAANGLTLVVAMDHSRSIASDQFDWMRGRVSELARAMDPRDRLAVLTFGRDVRLISQPDDPRLAAKSASAAAAAQIDSGATDIAGALTAARALFTDTRSAAANGEKRVLLLSDGNETQAKALDELPALAEEGLRVFTAAPAPSRAARVSLVEFGAPNRIDAGHSFAFNLGIESEAPQPADARLVLNADGAMLGAQSIRLAPGLNRFELPYQIDKAGAYLVSAEVQIAPPRVAIAPRSETALTVNPPARVLVVTSSPPSSFVDALTLRGYHIEQASPRGLPERPADYLGYQAVIIADAGADALSARVQAALNRYVAELGGGLIVTGESLRDERFGGSELEKTLPVKFEPQPPPPSREPLAVYLCIDRSNSMSYNSRYPAVRDSERIRYAKQAAVALLRQLDDTDMVGVIAFDSQPYILTHLRPLGEVRDELERRVERLEPGGGTDFKESLEIAEHEILQSGVAVRQVVLLTDGDTNRQYHDHDELIADFAEKKIPVSTIRIGPDLANLRLLEDFAQATGGVFYRVGDIEKLPQLLVRLTRKAMTQKQGGQAKIEFDGRSRILSGFSPPDIPPLEFVTTTTAKDSALVPLKVRRGSQATPLLSAWQYGLGRAVVFAADPDSLGTLSWIRWDRYAEFWSQVVGWSMREGDAGPFTLRIENAEDGGLRLLAEKADPGPASNLFCRITGNGRAFDVAMTPSQQSLYRGDAPRLDRGKYTATLMRKGGDTEQAIVSREFAAVGAAAADAAELRIRPPNLELLRRLAIESGGQFDAPIGAILQRNGAMVTAHSPATPYLAPIAIALLLMEVFVRRRFLG